MGLLKNRYLLTLALAHFTSDTYSNMLPILWPVFLVTFNLEYAQVGFATACYTFAGALTQPLFGYLGEKFGSRWLGALGVGWVAICISATALAPRLQRYRGAHRARGAGLGGLSSSGGVEHQLDQRAAGRPRHGRLHGRRLAGLRSGAGDRRHRPRVGLRLTGRAVSRHTRPAALVVAVQAAGSGR